MAKQSNERRRKLYDALNLAALGYCRYDINDMHKMFLVDLAQNISFGVKCSLEDIRTTALAASDALLNITDARPIALKIRDLIKDGEDVSIDTPLDEEPLELFSSACEPEKYEYLWYPYLVKNNLNVLFSAGGGGKGFLCGLIAKNIMTGEEFPNGESIEPGSVLLYTAEEEDAKATEKYIRCGTPKSVTDKHLKIIDKVKIKKYADRYGTDTPYPIGEALDKIPDAKLVIIDPIENYLPSTINANSRADVSQFLSGMSAMCTKHGVTILYICHENKKEGVGGGSTNNKASGSGSFIDVPRSAIQVCCETDENGQTIQYMVHTKHNTTAEGTAYKFVITDNSVEWDGVIDRSRADLDKARGRGESVGELKNREKNKLDLNNNLIYGICTVARREYEKTRDLTKSYKVSYNNFKLEFGENGDVFGGQKASKALESVSTELRKHGVILNGTNVTAAWSKDRYGNKHNEKGFSVSICNIEKLNNYFSNDYGIH